MGVRHESAAIEGVQFHPESIKTDQGAQMISNFLSWKSGTWEQMGGVPKSILQRIIATLPERPTHEVRLVFLIVVLKSKLPQIPMFWKHSVMDMSVVLQQSGMSVVAEVKRASPSKGAIATGTVDAGELASLYASCAGVAAVSVLTEPFFFKGSLDDLQRAREFVEAEAKQSGRKRVALLRKDFVICEAQIVEAREHGADSVLLIAATLSLRKLQTLLHFSRQCELEPLVEVANELELDRAISVGAKLIGVNARDLHSFQVDVERAARLIELGKARSPSTTWVGLSGVSENAHTQRYLRAGATAVVVGEHLMKATSVPSAIAEILGRSAPVKVKVCGLTRDEDVELACKEGADYLGLIFAPASKRVVSVARAVEMAAVARRHSPHPPKIVGVFSKNSDEEIVRFHEAVKFDVIQLCDATSEVRPKDVEVWRVVHISPDAGATTMALNKAREDRLLFDTASAAGGGSGVKFEWSKVLAGREDFVLAGGLTPANVADAARTGAWCVDVCSGCEESPGVKNAALVRRFVRNAKCGECRGLVEILKTLASNAGASADEIANILQMATRGTLTDAQVGGFLTVLAARKDVEQSPAVLRQARSVLLAAGKQEWEEKKNRLPEELISETFCRTRRLLGHCGNWRRRSGHVQCEHSCRCVGERKEKRSDVCLF
jgi:anthranilate synthase/indole-3-glycerol phosphate synthase/phosphoribosylanthranilate isomerase